MIIVLHDIRSSHNVGSIFRTADAVGCTKIYLCGITPAPVDRFGRKNSDIAKVALGAEDWIPWEHVVSASRLIDRLKKQGNTILALEQDATSVPYTKVHIPSTQWKSTVLILGNEVKGLSKALIKRAGTIIEIPMHGKKESLNVAVAFGIVSFSLRQTKLV